MRRGLFLLAGAGAILFAVAAGCRTPTEMTLALSSPEVACAELDGITLTTAASASEAEEKASTFVTTSVPCPGPSAHDLGTLVVVPGESDRAGVIVVAGLTSKVSDCRPPDYTGCIVARRALGFVEHERLTVPIELDPSCARAGVVCPVDRTCRDGACVLSTPECDDDGTCRLGEEVVPGERVEPPDAGDAGREGGPPIADAGVDAAFDASTLGCAMKCNQKVSCDVTLGVACCFTSAPTNTPLPAPTCEAPQACFTHAPEAGILGCCRGQAQCPGGQCCFHSITGDGHVEPHGYTYCHAGSCPSGDRRVCKDDPGCPTGQVCRVIQSNGFTNGVFACTDLP